MDDILQSEAWKALGLTLSAVCVDDAWEVKVRRSDNTSGQIQFKVRTRVEHGRLDPHDAFISMCETVAGMPVEEGEDAYQIWLGCCGFSDTNSYRSQFQQLLKQRESLFSVLGHATVYAVATIRPVEKRKRALPTIHAGVRPTDLYPAAGVQVS